MGLDPKSKAQFNLERASVLLLDENPMGMKILVQILTGFGARTLSRCGSVEKAEQAIGHGQYDLIIVDSLGAAGAGYDFVRWLRSSGIQPNCFAPVLITAGHTPASAVSQARDCGAHFILAKPMTPKLVLERIIWISKEGRRFVECDSYVGPDRRFKTEGPPRGVLGRRHEDAAPAQSDPSTPPIEQDSVNSMNNTRRVQI